jgi:hypothetical protein
MTNIQTHRRLRNRLLAAVALLIYLALLALWQIDNIRGSSSEPSSAFVLGTILGAMTCVAFVVRRRWTLFLASRP